MRIRDTDLPGVRLIEPQVHRDARGYFLETWQGRRYQDALGINDDFVQHNQSCSGHGVLRGMHFQRERGQGKLVRAVHGRVWDVTIDLRADSSSFGRWLGVELSGIEDAGSSRPHQQLWVPAGFAHGFLVLSQAAVVEYLCTDVYVPGDEVCLRWDDPEVGVTWPLPQPILSERDAQGRSLAQLKESGRLPVAVVADLPVAGRP